MSPPNWNDSDDDVNLNEVLFEYISVGNAVRVCAIDPITGTEVVVVGSGAMSHYTLKMNALRKLKFVLAKKQAGSPGTRTGVNRTHPRPETRGRANSKTKGQNSFRANIPLKR